MVRAPRSQDGWDLAPHPYGSPQVTHTGATSVSRQECTSLLLLRQPGIDAACRAALLFEPVRIGLLGVVLGRELLPMHDGRRVAFREVDDRHGALEPHDFPEGDPVPRRHDRVPRDLLVVTILQLRGKALWPRGRSCWV